jgi:hypothetical protein
MDKSNQTKKSELAVATSPNEEKIVIFANFIIDRILEQAIVTSSNPTLEKSK